MKAAPHFALLLALLVLGCAAEPEKKAEDKKLFLELEIRSPATRKISVDKDGNVADVISGSRAAGKLAAADWKALQDLAAKVEWAKLPVEGWKAPGGAPAAGGRTYDLTWHGTSPPRLVHSMDGAAEDPGFAKLRDTVELDANRTAR